MGSFDNYDFTFKQKMLARLLSDIRFFFGHGDRNADYSLYFKDINRHIDEMNILIDDLTAHGYTTPDGVNRHDTNILLECAKNDPLKVPFEYFDRAYKNGDYMTKSTLADAVFKNRVCGFIPDHGATLYFLDLHFIVVDNNGKRIFI